MSDTALSMRSAAEERDRGSLRFVLFVAFLATTAYVSLRARPPGELWASDGFDGPVVYRLFVWMVLGVIALWCVRQGRTDWKLLRGGPLLWYSGYIVLALFSAPYALSSSLTFYYSMQLAVALLLAISLRQHHDKFPWIAAVYLAVYWVLILGALVPGPLTEWLRNAQETYYAVNGTDDPWRFGDVFGHPSQISIVASVAALQLAARIDRANFRTRGPMIAWMVLTILLTVSRTAIAGLIVGLIIVAFARRMVVGVLLLATLVSLALMFTDVQDGLSRYMLRGQSAEEFASLSGRDRIYEAALQRAADASVLGIGFKSGRRELLINDDGGSHIAHSHNMFLESLVGLGLGGLLTISLVFLTGAQLTWHVMRRPPQEAPQALRGWELCAIAMPLLGFCVMDLGFASEATPVLFTYLLLFARVQTDVLNERSVSVRDPRLSLAAFSGLKPMGTFGSPG